MKKSIHPELKELSVFMVSGREVKMVTASDKTKIHLDTDPETHVAWTGKRRMVERGGELEKFQDRYGGLSF